MVISFMVKKSQLRVISAVSSNFVVVWLAALFTTRDIAALIFNIIVAILFWHLAAKAEDALEHD